MQVIRLFKCQWVEVEYPLYFEVSDRNRSMPGIQSPPNPPGASTPGELLQVGADVPGQLQPVEYLESLQ